MFYSMFLFPCLYELWLVGFLLYEGCIPEDWKSSVVFPIYKGNGI